ncbi:hypothetical protein GW17_00011594 [Ensete ventricosum]|nr:hypothetical protein GW17_00011594 [Ensete ventricosum]
MDMAGRRSTYSLLSQSPDDSPPPPKFESPPTDKARARASPFDWSIAPAVAPLQRQSSGSSYGESSLSGGDFYVPATISSATVDADAFSRMAALTSAGGGEGRTKDGAVVEASLSSSAKSWAQQTEETYQLQLALALRLCSEAACADDPNFLDALDQTVLPERVAPASISHRFWTFRLLAREKNRPWVQTATTRGRPVGGDGVRTTARERPAGGDGRGAVVAQGDVVDFSSRPFNEKSVEVISSPLAAAGTELCELPLPNIQKVARPEPSKAVHRDVLHIIPPDPKADKKDFRLTKDSKQGHNRPNNEISFAVDDLNIPWSELVLKERIGAGKCTSFLIIYIL